MKVKKSPVEKKIDKLAVAVERGFSAMADDLAEVKGDLVDVKGGLREVNIRLSSIESELRDIKRRLDLLEESVEGMKGYATEIDELRGRIKVIEQQLKIRHKVAA